MTRRTDKIKKNKEQARIQHNLSKSRLYQKNQEIVQEKETLKKISNLPPELIRIIYQYMSGNAKLLCNYKYDYLEKYMNRYPTQKNIDFMRNLSKQEVLNFLYKGVLRKYPEIIESMENEYHYDLATQDFTTVDGYNLLNLWENNRLAYDFESRTYVADHPDIQIDMIIKDETTHAIYHFLEHSVNMYMTNKRKALLRKTWTISGNALFLKLDKAFYLFKCLNDLYQHDNLNNQSKSSTVMNDTGGIYGVYTNM